MDSVDPSTARDVFIILATIVTMVCMVINTWNKAKAKPPTGQSIATIGERMGALERDLTETKVRLAAHEDKISRQIGALHERINNVFGELQLLTGMLRTHMEKAQ